MTLLRLLWIALIVGSPALADEVDCVTCAGTGRAEQACAPCRGNGDHGCTTCTSFRFKASPRWDERWVPRALLLAISDDLKESMAKLGKIDIRFPGTPKNSPKGVRLKPGEFRCTARCRGGKLLHIESWVDCKLCKGGKFRCADCKKGMVECLPCDGSGAVVRACDDCAGLGRVPDPASVEVKACPWCQGAATRACGSCDELGQVPLACQACLGAEVLPCLECRGLGERACKRCGGRGRYGPRKENCDDCDRKGVLDCGACVDGKIDCPGCATSPGRAVKCPHCAGKKQHPCNGCQSGAFRAWEHAAETLSHQGDFAAAVERLSMARGRCERRYAGALRVAEGQDDAAKRRKFVRAVKGELAEQLKRIDRALKKARTESGKD